MLRFFIPAAILSLAVAIVASAQHYGTYNHNSAYHVRTETVIVPVVVPNTVYLNLSAPEYPATATVSPSAFDRAEEASNAIAKRLDELDAKISRLTAPAAAPARSAPPKLKLKVNVETVTLAQVAGIFNQHCASCHTGSKAEESTGVRIFNDNGEYDPSVPVATLIAAATRERNPMPKGPNKVPSAQQRILKLWNR